MPYLVQHLLGEGASREPDRDAVRIGSRALRYGELDTLSTQLAHVLREVGVRRGDRVGLYLTKSLESVIGIYGIMKAGAAYVPLDPFAPPSRLAAVLGDCGIRCLVTCEAMVDSVEKLRACFSGIEALIGVLPKEHLGLRAIPWAEVRSAPFSPASGAPIEQDLAYILYTSGSTGNPKGIMHTHRSALSFVEWAAREVGLRAADRLSNHAPFHFDLSTFDLFASALAGATTILIPEAVTKFPANVAELIEIERITVWYSVPLALLQLLARGALAARDLSRLRWVIFAGELFPTKHLRELMSRLPGARFSNWYGPTETNVCTSYHVPPLPPGSDEPIPIGRACANTETLVVDPADRPVSPGEVGELLVRGAVVMRGYWGRPEPDPRAFFCRAASSRSDVFYRTGDLVEELPSGDYRFVGRRDRQVKTRGYRVELDEIEAALLSHPAVTEASVYAVPDAEGSSRIEAVVILEPGAAVEPAALVDHIALRLPAYAVPACLRVSDDFPRTSTGKVDRRELRERAIAAFADLESGHRAGLKVTIA